MSTATQQTTYTTGLSVTATILNNEIGNIITNLNAIYDFVDIDSGDVYLKPTSDGNVVVIENLPRNNSGSATYVDSFIQSGWGYVQGDSINSILSRNVTFPVAYSSSNVRVLISHAGIKSSSNPTAEASFITQDIRAGWHTTAVSTTGFTAEVVQLLDGGVLPSSSRFGFFWIAIGPK